MSNTENPNSGEQIINAVKLVADTTILPGSGQLIEGSVGTGVVYAAAGFALKAIFGPVLFLGVGLDSYSKSSSGKHLWELFGKSKKEAPKPVAEPAQP